MKQLMGPKGEGYVVIQFILFAIIFFAPGQFDSATQWPQWLATLGLIVGGILLLYGVVMIMLGMLHLGLNLTAVPMPKASATLVEHGAYRLVRHPIYSGISLGVIGWGGINEAEITVLLSLLLLIFFDIKTRREEEMLTAQFPEYCAYQRRVRKLIPYLY